MRANVDKRTTEEEGDRANLRMLVPLASFAKESLDALKVVTSGGLEVVAEAPRLRPPLGSSKSVRYSSGNGHPGGEIPSPVASLAPRGTNPEPWPNAGMQIAFESRHVPSDMFWSPCCGCVGR